MVRAWAWWAYVCAWLLAPLWVSSSFALGLLSQIGIAAIVCLSYNILLGQGGMLSFGHAVYSGAGAYLAIHTLRLVTGGWPLPVVLVPLAGGLGGGVLALVLGWVSTRKAGMSFAMITLGIGELVWAGVVLLILAIVTGAMFVEDLLAQDVAHKTVFSILSLLVFVALLIGRHTKGWRGVTASRWTLAGCALLMVAFYGSKLVLELIFHRGL